MKLTPADKVLFQNLHDSAIGAQLLDYLERLQAEICDVRNLSEGDSPETVKRILGVFERQLVDKIKLQSKPAEAPKEEFV